ncbi:MAG: NADH-quinone oxidoreductase subunit M [Pseudomonadota bacterium]|nr:NADH-quinone oxidoreductase subunit M [Pseudomonadota bacterium]
MVENLLSMAAGLPLLSLLILILPAGAGLIWLFADARMARWVALLTAIAGLLISIAVVAGFDAAAPGFQFVEKRVWIPTLNIHYTLGVDGISLFFLPLTSLLFIGVILSSWRSIRSMTKLYFALLLLFQSTIIGIFTALDTILFFLFWELSLVPIYFLISLYGIGPNRRYAALKYMLLMMVGGVPLLFGFVLLAIYQPGDALVFDYMALHEHLHDEQTQIMIFLLLLFGFAFKTPLFPLHTWLPVVTMEGPIAIGVIMTGLKLGAYGLIRFVAPLAPTAAQEFHWLLAVLGVVAILYGALMAMQQSNLRRMLAFSSVSHIGLVVLAISSFNIQGIQGALYQILNFTIVSGGIFLLTGFLHHRTGSTEIISLGGVATKMPLLAAFFFLFGLAAIGVPGTSGFPAEFLMILSALKTHTGAGLAALFGVILGAGYFLSIFRKAFLGPVTNSVVDECVDLRWRELLVVTVFALLILLGGLFPSLVMDITETASTSWVARLSG